MDGGVEVELVENEVVSVVKEEEVVDVGVALAVEEVVNVENDV